MNTDHRGRPTGTNHRPTPRLEQILNKYAGGMGQSIINAHRSGTSSFVDVPSTQATMDDAERKAGYHQTKSGFNTQNGPYHEGEMEMYEGIADSARDALGAQSAVDAAGGTGALIGKAVKDRKNYRGEIEI